MRNARRMSLILCALVLFAIASSCKGFFVNQPNSLSVTTATGGSSFAASPTAQLKATASYGSGNKDVTNSANWQSSTACATVSSTGLVTAVGSASSVSVSATLAGVSGSITGSTTGGTTQTLTITPTGTQLLANGTVQFTATDSGSNDVTSNATWTSSNTSVLTFSTSSPGLATLLAAGTTTVSASTASSGSCASGTASITVQ
jgi:hypothetical protein